MGLTDICSLPQASNPASYRVCERLGMLYEGMVECPPTERRGSVEARLYALTASDWYASQADGDE